MSRRGHAGETLLLACLQAELTPRQREAFIDTACVGRSTSEVAASMGVSRSAVGLLVAKARVKLARARVVRDLRSAA